MSVPPPGVVDAKASAEAQQWLVASLFLVLGVGAAKAYVGGEVTLSALFVLPVMMSAWHAGRLAAAGVALLGALTYLLAHAVVGERSVASVLASAAVNLAVSGVAIAVVGRFRAALEERTRATEALQAALDSVRARGTVRYCAACRTLAEGAGDWEPVEDFVARHTRAHVALTLCPDCSHVRR